MPTQTPRLLFVHAHPDDESLNNGATIAHYAARGAQVTVLTCTLGEEGEVIGDRWSRLAVDHADQLGGYRISELTAALNQLGIGEPMFLGGAGRWRDSGMAGTEPRSRSRRFVDSGDAAITELADAIAELRPHVVVTYDPNGGYGHPDHIRAHEVTTAAVAAVAPRWEVPKFYWTVTSISAFTAAAAALTSDDLLPHWHIPEGGTDEIGFADHHISTRIDAADGLAAKIGALRAHATQVIIGPTARACALSNDLALPIVGEEHYVLVSGPGGRRDAQGYETDLLAGIDLD
ncbi:MAG: N-acetyl-1-D-myo-inositol-2-amino-2-deoxy-alpha-D-glucopyranoside deacetylase [Mycobacterium sp.]|nr:N-acetyl-1-D-myo-inositol-2-amino-2-deoxy-alpha-D-glucopyranoside deacetylase [Mycobacterium sp.]